MPSRLFSWLVLIAVFTAFGVPPARASGAMVGQRLDVCVVTSKSVTTAAQVFANPGVLDCTTPQTKFGPGDYWVLSGPVPKSIQGDRPVRVRTASVWQRAVTLYALYPDGRIVSHRMDDRDVPSQLQLGAIQQQPLPAQSAAPARLAWRVEGSANLRGILISPRIATPPESNNANIMMAALYAGFAGLAFGLLVHNFALWGVLRQRFQLWYVAILASVLVYVFSSSGALAWLLPEISNTGRLRINYFSLALTGITALQFGRTFFEARVYTGWVGKLTDGVCVIMLVAATAFAVLAPWQIGLLDQFYSIAFLLLLVAVVPMIWRAWRLRSEYLWVFAAAWAAPITFTVIRVAHAFGLIGWNFWVDNSSLLGLAAEALGASLAIAYRIRQLADDRDTARAEGIAARTLADIDPLTGLLNRRAFLTKAIGRPGSQTLLVLDLDRFKSINDKIGHDGGDEVLRRVSAILREAGGERGLAARLGGEEFALLADADASLDARAILDRLRSEGMPYDLTVTASIGGCTGPISSESDWKALYRAADRALFAAKRAGRDRVHIASDPQTLAA